MSWLKISGDISRVAGFRGVARFQGNTVYVTIYGKTWHMGFSVKIEFDVSLISSTLELTCKFEAVHALHVGDSALFHELSIRIEIEKLRLEGVAMYMY